MTTGTRRAAAHRVAAFGQRLKQLRLAAGLTQAKLADQIGQRSGAIVSRWENGDATPDLFNLALLTEALDVSVDALLPRN